MVWCNHLCKMSERLQVGIDLASDLDQVWSSIHIKTGTFAEQFQQHLDTVTSDYSKVVDKIGDRAEKCAIQCFLTNMMRLKQDGRSKEEISEYLYVMWLTFGELYHNHAHKYREYKPFHDEWVQHLQPAEKSKGKKSRRGKKKK